MDFNSQFVARILQALANCSSSLGELAINLRKHPNVIRAQNSLEFHHYQTGDMIEGYVDVELHDGRAVCWWIDIQWQDSWKINSCIYLNDSRGQTTIHEFNEHNTSDFETFIKEINTATQELVKFNALELVG